MAKKSAKSKGYRKSAQKKPYLSKRDIIILCVLVAVLAVGAILLFTYDDGALKLKDGKIADAGENWLIVNGNLKGGRRYFKVGEVGDIPGYNREAEPFASDANLTQFKFTPEAEDSAVTGVTVSASAYDPSRLAEGNSKMVASLGGSDVSEVATGTVGNLEYSYYTYTNAYYSEDEAEDESGEEAAEAEEVSEDTAEETDEEPEPNHFEQAMNAYVSAPNSRSVVVVISAEADSPDSYLSEDQLKETLAQAVAAVTLEEGK